MPNLYNPLMAKTELALRIQVATQLLQAGRTGEAEPLFRQILARHPGNAQATLPLVELCKRRKQNSGAVELVDAMRRSNAEDPAVQRHAATLLAGLGRFDLARRSNRYSIEREAADYRRIQEAFPPDFFRRYSGSGIEDDSAIFVIGMARSGTTLLERILASHERVNGGGELTVFTELVDRIGIEVGTPFPFANADIDDTVLQVAARRYVSIIKGISANSDYVTNKNVANNVYFGMARIMMPNAKFIFVDRDPRDQSLSFFQKDFGENLPCYYSLEELGHRYHVYRRLEEHWRRVMPDSSLTIQYEDLVANPEARIRGLLEFCGLSFDPACLSFHESDDAVSTLSLTQVRRPLNSNSIGRWKNYKDHLKPLLDSLERHRGTSDQ